VETRHAGRLAVREDNAAAALEVMSRFAVDPRLLAYLPPTMAPSATAGEQGFLEHQAAPYPAWTDVNPLSSRKRGSQLFIPWLMKKHF
jgi:hypothetical protein